MGFPTCFEDADKMGNAGIVGKFQDKPRKTHFGKGLGESFSLIWLLIGLSQKVLARPSRLTLSYLWVS